jgi:ABC-type dipeptide/oligopeptide/nickel transport system permease component
VRAGEAAPVILYVARRLAYALLSVFAVVTVVFVLTRASGNTAELMAPPNSSPEEIARVEKDLGLDRPLVAQFGTYLRDLSHGDLGESATYRRPVRDLIADALPNSALLGLAAFVFALVVGGAIGTISALRPGSIADRSGKGVALLGQSVPSFWLAIVLVLIFAVKLGWFPAYGMGTWRHLVLPAVALGWLPLAAICRLTRSSMLEVLRTDHVTFEKSKGIGRVAFLRHVIRNASLPVVTLSAIQLGWLISGAVVIETVFSWPGTGQLAVQAITNRDYAVVQGVALVVTAIFVLLLFIVDISYGWLDPRTRSALRVRSS